MVLNKASFLFKELRRRRSGGRLTRWVAKICIVMKRRMAQNSFPSILHI